MSKWLTLEDVKQMGEGCFKYVRVNGQIRCGDLDSDPWLNHPRLAKPGEKVTSAGTFYVIKDLYWVMSRSYSDLLERDASEEDYREITNVLGLKEKRG